MLAIAKTDDWLAKPTAALGDFSTYFYGYFLAFLLIDQLFEAAKRAGEQRKAEARQRAQERVWRLEEQLRNVENALQRAEENYSRALSARSPSMRNPHWREISQKQLDRQSAARQKVQSIQQRRSEVIQKLGDARSRLNQF